MTHYEYLFAKYQGIDRLVFLLDESAPWPPHRIDGFSTRDPDAPKDAQAIRALRTELQLDAVVSYFSTPNELEVRVGTALTVASMSKQVRLNLAQVGQVYDTVNDRSPEDGIRNAIRTAGQQRVLQVDLASIWWSTRLYLTFLQAERLTDVRRILMVHGSTFVGLVSTDWILSVIDLLRILDYPSEFGPVVIRQSAVTGSNVMDAVLRESVQVADKSALNAQLAQSYVTELMESAQLV